MKLLCCSDTHAWTLPSINQPEAKAWLHAGDVYNHGRRNRMEMMTPKLTEWITNNQLPVYVVRGNHDCSTKSEFFDKYENVGGKLVELEPGLKLIGVGWAGGEYFDLPTESEMKKVCDEVRAEIIFKSMPTDKFILLTHYPPWSPKLYQFRGCPEGWMFEEIMKLVEEVKPLAIIQGHVHELFGYQMIYEKDFVFKSLVVSPGPYGGTLTVDTATSKVEFEFTPEALAKRKKDVQSEEETDSGSAAA